MVRHTHRRRQSKGRRRNTRRSRRTQRGGFSFSSFFGSSDDVTDLKKKLAQETDPIKKAEIQKDITCAEAKEKLEQVKKSIEEKGSAGAALSSTGVTNNMTRNSAGQFQSSASNANGDGAGYGANNSMYSGTGGRRRSRRYRRR